jgi:hypothetical protein
LLIALFGDAVVENSLHLSLSASLSVALHFSLSGSMHVPLSVSLSVSLHVELHVALDVALHVSLSVSLSVPLYSELAQCPCRCRAARSGRWACMHTDGADIASSRYHHNRITAPSQQRDQCAFVQFLSHANATLTQSEVYVLWIVMTPKGVSSSMMQRQARPLLVPARE